MMGLGGDFSVLFLVPLPLTNLSTLSVLSPFYLSTTKSGTFSKKRSRRHVEYITA